MLHSDIIFTDIKNTIQACQNGRLKNAKPATLPCRTACWDIGQFFLRKEKNIID